MYMNKELMYLLLNFMCTCMVNDDIHLNIENIPTRDLLNLSTAQK